jgi:hypothetical protein
MYLKYRIAERLQMYPSTRLRSKLKYFEKRHKTQELSSKVTLGFTPLSRLLSPPIPSFSGICKVRKFYFKLGMK